MRMKKPSCTITDSGTMIRSRDSIRSRIRLDWQVVIQLCMDMFMIQILNWIYWDFLNITVRQSRQSGVARATCPD